MIYKLLPPNDERVLSSIVPFDMEEFKKQEKIGITEFCNNMFETMKNYGGIGLSANQVGKPYRLFVMGDNPNIEKGKKWVCINPEITNVSKDTIRYKEGCLTFPFLFLDIERPQKVKVRYLNEQLDKIEGSHYFLDHSSDHKPHPLPVAHRLWGHNVYNLMAK